MSLFAALPLEVPEDGARIDVEISRRLGAVAVVQGQDLLM
jgi:hypothetical protein